MNGSEALPYRPVMTALIGELSRVGQNANSPQIANIVWISWTALALGKHPENRGEGALLVNAGVRGEGGG